MGVDLNCAQLLLRAKRNGVSFERLATLGRQGLHANRPALTTILRNAGFLLSRDCEAGLLDPSREYADDFFRILGAREIVAIDASDYEGAQIVHDMNMPIPENLVASFDAVLDGGTLEHVFNFPTAFRSAISLVRVNGRFISFTVTNNFCGHGFYQFSPELFHRLLREENGYRMESCIIWEEIRGSRFYEVPDPVSRGRRIELTSRSGSYLFVQGTRVGPIRDDYVPEQSDYVAHWTGSSRNRNGSGNPNAFRAALKKIPGLRSSVLFARDLQRRSLLRPLYTEAEYRARLVHRNTRTDLTPLEGLRVRL